MAQSVGVNDLPRRILQTDPRSDADPSTAIEVGRDVTLDRLEAEHIRLTLDRSRTRDDAARILGIDPSTLYRKRKQLGL